MKRRRPKRREYTYTCVNHRDVENDTIPICPLCGSFAWWVRVADMKVGTSCRECYENNLPYEVPYPYL